MKRTTFHLPYDPELVSRARELRKTMTPAEKRLWHDYLKKLKVRVLRQRPIDRFIVDFYCASAKLVIEVDGEEHASPEGIAYDLERTQVLEGYGLRVVRFSNEEVLENFEKICERLEAMVYPPTPLKKGGKPQYHTARYSHFTSKKSIPQPQPPFLRGVAPERSGLSRGDVVGWVRECPTQPED